MNDVARHYDTLLAAHYTWMHGNPAAKVAEERALLQSLGVTTGNGTAVDLGAGPGFQSLALAQLGYRVHAVDFSVPLLQELQARRGALPIETVVADLGALRTLELRGLDLAVCMGDTLTHLPSHDDVTRFLGDVAETLRPGGSLVLTWRDLSVELHGLDRFVPVRSDDTRIFTCFLQYEAHTVLVHDLVHVRDGPGWTLHKSAYRKLRLTSSWVEERLRAAGFTVRRSEPAGRLWATVAERR